MLYFFILGRHPVLSLAEIFSVFKDEVDLVSFSDNFAVFEFKEELNVSQILNNFGGSIKFGKIIRKDVTDIQEIIFDNLLRQSKKDKLFFGISGYGKIKINLRTLGFKVKKRIRDSGRTCRFVTSREKTLSSIVVKKNKLLSSSGIEFVILNNGRDNFLGKTLAVQEFEEYSARDYLKPERSMVRGMLPPKLAKIMVNLSRAPRDGIILDPFCGTGTILGEAVLLGYKNLIGADNDFKAIKETERNIDWLKQNFSPYGGSPEGRQLPIINFQLFNIDAREISKQLKKQMIDAIVTEPYLGPPMKGSESLKKIKKIIPSLKNLYLESFKEFKKILKPNGSVVFVLPIFKTPRLKSSLFKKEGGKEGDLYLNIKSELKKIGFEVVNPLPKKVQQDVVRGFSLAFGPNGGFIYSRPDQRIWREILILKLKIKNQK